MPYASNGKIAEEEFEGSIEITSLQYREALDGMCAGLIVSISDGFKVAPAPPVEPEPAPLPSPEELAALVLAQRDQLLGVAAIRIAPLQDAVDLGRASPEAIALLGRWKNYRVDLNEIEQQGGFPEVVDWPVAPS